MDDDDEAITKACADILNFTQLANMTALQYCEALLAKAICVGDVYDDGTLNDTFIE